MQLCGTLNNFWHCLSLGLEWKLTFSSPVATAEFSKFAGILCATLYLFECKFTGILSATASSFRMWKSSTGIPSPPLALFVVTFLRPTRLHLPGRLALGEWSHHHGYLGHEDLFCTVLCVFFPSFLNVFCSSASLRSILFLSFIVSILAWNVPLVFLIFLMRSLVFPILLLSSIFFFAFITEEGFSYISLLFFVSLHSGGYIFPFILCL